MEMISFIKKNKQIFLFLLFGALSASYFVLQQIITTPYHNIHIPLDDMIPFLEIFIIPYVLWYIYIPLPMILTCFSEQKRDFYAMCTLLFSGAFISVIIFAIYPTCIDFRPDSFDRDNLFIRLTELIYSNDKPTNVCPSLHCYESVAIHIAFCKSKLAESRKSVKIASFIIAVLICLSTVFVKQHSAVDVFFGVLLIIPTYWLTYKVIMPLIDRKLS